MPDKEPETNVEGAEITPSAETTPETEQEVDWKAKAEELETRTKEQATKIQEFEANYKAAQRNLEAARKGGADPEAIKELKGELKAVREGLDYLLDAQAGVEVSPERRREIAQRQAEEQQRRSAEQAVSDFYSAAEEAGLTRDDPRVVKITKETATPLEGMRRLFSLKVQIEREAQTNAQEEAKAKALVKEREEKEKTGALTVEAGGTRKVAGKALTAQDVRGMSPDEILKNSAEIAKLSLTI